MASALNAVLGTGGGSAPRIYPLYPHQIPGVDYPVGRTSINALKVPGVDALPVGTSRISERIIITGAGVSLVDWDLRGFWVDQTTGVGTTIEQCLIDNSAAPGGNNVSYAVYHQNDVTIRYSTITGVDAPNVGTGLVGHYPSSATAKLFYEYNDSSQAAQFHMTFAGGTVRYNRMLGVGYLAGAHGNIIFNGRCNFPSEVYENYCDMLPCPDPTARWSYCFFATSINGDNGLGIDVRDNLFLNGSFIAAAGDVRYPNVMAGIDFHDNYCDVSHASCFGYLYPTYQGAMVGVNYNVLTGADFTTPPGDITDLSASVLSSTSVQLSFTPAVNADSYEYSYNTVGTSWDNPAWTAMPSNGIVTGVTGADTKYWRVRALRAGTGNKSGIIAGNASNIILAASAHSAEANAFLARTSGLDIKHQDAYYGLIDGLVSDGVWSKLDLLYIFATQDSTTALLNLISSSYTATASGAPTFAADVGFTTASGKFIDTNWVFSTNGVNYTQNAASIFAWSGSSAAATNNARILASAAAFNGQVSLHPRNTSDQAQLQINDSSPIGTPTNTDGTGLYVGVRVDSTTKQIWKNSAQLGSDITRASVALQAVSLQTGGNNAVASNAYAGIVKAMGAGGALTGTDIGNLYTRLTDYYAALV